MRRGPRTQALAVARALRFEGSRAWSYAAELLARVEPRREPLLVSPGDAPLGSRVVVFCHFSRGGSVAERVRRYVEALQSTDLSIVFVTNSGGLQDEARSWLLKRCALVVVRRNVGYDFAAWRDGLSVAELPRRETDLLLVVNDSVYGPFAPLDDLLRRLDFDVADVWGLTDSWQNRYHLQSYFLAFGPAALASPAFRSFWAGVRDIRSKAAVIRTGEIGLTQAMLRAGLRCEALWPYLDVVRCLTPEALPVEGEIRPPIEGLKRIADTRNLQAAALRQALNPTADLWRQLLLEGFPFLKRELLRDNPAGVPDVGAWHSLLQEISPLETAIVLRDLRTALRGSAP